MNLKVLLPAAVAFALTISAVPATAEIVVLTSGRTLSVRSHRVEGESIVLTLRGGGEVTCDRTLVDRILPDEVPYPEPEAEAVDTDQDENDSSLLQSTPYGEIISALSEAHGVDPMLVRALIQVESGYRPTAR
jgi:hypothetical protein